MPDYSHFQSGFEKHTRLGIAAVRMESHQHTEDGGWHLSIDVRLGPHQELYLEAIKNGFNALMAALSPVPPIHEENYSGEDATKADERSIDDYYREAHQKWIRPDPFRSH